MTDLPSDADPPDPPDNNPEPNETRPPSAPRAEAEASMAAEDQLPTRQETRTTSRPDHQPLNEPSPPSGHDEPDQSAEHGEPASTARHDGNLTQAAQPDTIPHPPEQPGQGDSPESTEARPASAYPTKAEARIAAEDQLPARQPTGATPRPDHKAPNEANPTSEPHANPDTGNAANNGERPAEAPTADAPATLDASTDPATRPGETDNAPPDPGEHPISVRNTDGADVQITVEYLPPEARTVGDTTPTGIGRKPSGEELPDLGDDPSEGRMDRFVMEAFKEGPDVRDLFGNSVEVLHDLKLPGSGPSGVHVHEGQPVHEPAPSAVTPFSDLFGSAALMGVTVLMGIRYMARRLGKGDER